MDSDTTYNSKNNLFTIDDLKKIFPDINISKQLDISVYQRAFVHSSYCTRKNENFEEANIHCPKDCLPLQETSYERFEFLGDALLNTVTSDYLYHRYPYEQEGFLAKMKTKLVNGTMLAYLSKCAGFDKYIIISKQIEESDGRSTKSILEDVFEAFLGALYTDFSKINTGIGYTAVQDFIVYVFEEYIDFAELINRNNNYKDILSKYFQHNFQSVPKFIELDSKIVNNKKEYVYATKDHNGTIIGVGRGENIKKAQQEAAKTALVYYGAAI